MALNYWNGEIENWIDVFSDDEPDLMGLQLVKEFDDLTKKFYGIFDNDADEWAGYSEIYVGIRSEVIHNNIKDKRIPKFLSTAARKDRSIQQDSKE